MTERDYEVVCPGCRSAVGSTVEVCPGCGVVLLGERSAADHLGLVKAGSVARSLLTGALDSGAAVASDMVAAIFDGFIGKHERSSNSYRVEWQGTNGLFTAGVSTVLPHVGTEVWIQAPIRRGNHAAAEELCSWLNRKRRLFGFSVDYDRGLVVNRTDLDCMTAEDAISYELVRNAIIACIYGAEVAAPCIAAVVAGTASPQEALALADDDGRRDCETVAVEGADAPDVENELKAVVRKVLSHGEWHSLGGEPWMWHERDGNQFVIEATTVPGEGFVAFVDVEGASLATTTYFTDSFERVPVDRIDATRKLCSLLNAHEPAPLCSVTPETAGVYTRTWTTFAGSLRSMTPQMVDNCIRIPIGAAALFAPAVDAVVLDRVRPSRAVERFLKRW